MYNISTFHPFKNTVNELKLQKINFENQREIEKHFNDNKPAAYDACSNLIFDFTKYFHDINYIDQPFSIIYLISSDENDYLNELSNLM